MNIEPIIFVELVFTIFVLGLTLVIVVIYFARSIKKYHEAGQLNSGANIEEANMLGEARDKAIKIIDEANNKGLDIIQKANLFVGQAHDNFNDQLKDVTSMHLKSFEKATSEFINLYSNVLQDLKSKNIEVFQNVSKNIEISTLEEVKKFKNTIEEETISSQKNLKSKIDEEYLLAKKDVENFRQNQLKMLDDNIYEILEKISILVLGHAIKISDHEELISQALDKAKKEGVFGNDY